MSVVCVKVSNENIWFSADSITMSGYTKLPSISKLQRVNDLIIGGVGKTEEISLFFMFAQTHKPLCGDEKSIIEFVFEFYSWKKEYTDTFQSDCEYLIGFDGKAFLVQGLLVKEIKDYYAIGAGRDYALGVLWCGLSANDAVNASCNLCCLVSDPIVDIEMKKIKKERQNVTCI